MNRGVGFLWSAGLAMLLAMLALSPGKASAQDLRITLTGLKEAGDRCIASMDIANAYPAPLDRFSIDLVVFDAADEAIDRTVLDMAPLPNGHITISLPLGVGCGRIAHLLVHDLPSCRVTGETTMRDCHAGLAVSSNLSVDLRK